jgi:hypothetical protein
MELFDVRNLSTPFLTWTEAAWSSGQRSSGVSGLLGELLP